MTMSMAALHATDRNLKDPIFIASQICQEAIKEHGAEKVTNATIGTVLDETGKLAVIPTVENVFRSMDMTELTAYAPIWGLADYRSAVNEIIFGHAKFNGYFASVATAGGTGAIHHAIANYAERGDDVLTSDWRWGTYDLICRETGKSLTTFKLFNDDLTAFNIEDFSAQVETLLQKQNSLLIIINSPAHNPTGYSLSDDEWEKVLDVIKTHAASGKKISLLLDIAYIDFSAENAWGFMRKFNNLPSNVILLVAFSMSKSYTFYGQRTGALAAYSVDADVIDEFQETSKYSCRATWSNINRGAQALLVKIHNDAALRQSLNEEQALLRNMVKARAEIFVKEAEQCGLKIVPYRGGFFIAVPSDDPQAVCERLHKDLIFAVPLKLGVRVAACSTPIAKIPGLAEKIRDAVKGLQ